jgi:hypothetical protein
MRPDPSKIARQIKAKASLNFQKKSVPRIRAEKTAIEDT